MIFPITTVTGTGNLYPETYQIAKEEVETTFDLQKAPVVPHSHCFASHQKTTFFCARCITSSLIRGPCRFWRKSWRRSIRHFPCRAPSPLPALPITYGDYSEWQRKWFTTEKVQQQLTFWKNELDEAPPVLELRIQRPRSPEQTFAGASQTVPLSDEIISGLKALSVHLQATPFMLLLAAFKILLYRASGQPDILVGVPVAGRNPVETEGLVGFFVNTLVLRNDLFGNRPFPDLVAQVRETTLRAFANADVPFENVVEVLQPERNLSYNPIFQVMFSVIKSAVQSHKFGELTAFPYVVSPNTSIFDLSMTVIEGVDGQWWAELDYNTDLFDSKDIASMLADYTNLLEAIVDSSESRILDFPLAESAPGEIPRPATSRPIRSKREPVLTGSTSARSAQLEEPFGEEEQLLVGIWKNLLRAAAGRDR